MLNKSVFNIKYALALIVIVIISLSGALIYKNNAKPNMKSAGEIKVNPQNQALIDAIKQYDIKQVLANTDNGGVDQQKTKDSYKVNVILFGADDKYAYTSISCSGTIYYRNGAAPSTCTEWVAQEGPVYAFTRYEFTKSGDTYTVTGEYHVDNEFITSEKFEDVFPKDIIKAIKADSRFKI